MENIVFFKDEKPSHFIGPAELARHFDSLGPRHPFWAAAREFGTVGGAPALIGILVTLTICFLTIKGSMSAEVLSHALTSILGFYFGSKVGKGVGAHL